MASPATAHPHVKSAISLESHRKFAHSKRGRYPELAADKPVSSGFKNHFGTFSI